jgi:DNA-binding response OmpR family regulator
LLVSGTREGNHIHVNNHSDYTILIVEDEPDILSLLQEHFAEEGYKTLAATSGTEAIMQAKTKHPDVILLDVMMPGMSGFDVCNILRDFPETRTTPIIFLTAVAEMPRKIMGLRLGANDYVTKPFDLRELTARVEVALRTTVSSTQEAAGRDAGPTAVTRGS